MIFAPYRNVLDLAHDANGSDDRHRPQLAWDEIDYELGGKRVEQLNFLIGLVLQPVSWRRDSGRRDWGTTREGEPPRADAEDCPLRDAG
ncbi:MAG: hypothetical protein KF883_02305 [Thermomicrobiales bacterium]|nr:hypothetical protein [Thermomicrobiales bacterium]